MPPRDEPPARDLPETLHEVGNALTVVVGWIDLALASLPGGGPAVEALEVARGRAARAQQLARRAIGGAPHVDPSRPVGAVVREVARGLSAARPGAVTVESVVAPELGQRLLPRGDAAGQVLTNLVLNALSVSQPGGVVRVQVRPEGEEAVLFEVVDQGPGVPPELRGALFTSGRTSRPDGVGIGLRHAATLAAEVGGTLRLAHEVTSGATFQLVWPLSAAAPGPLGLGEVGPASVAPPSWPPGAALRGEGGALAAKRILLVEDDQAVVELLEAAIEARGARLAVMSDAASLSQGLAAAAPFDAVLLDLSPFGEEVASVVRRLREHSPGGRIVVISGSATQPADLSQVDAWVRKPFEVSDVLRVLVAPRGSRAG